MTAPYNFSAGPAMLPRAVLERAQEELRSWRGSGISVMEISHRDPAFVQMALKAEQDLRDLMTIPDHYQVLFMHGGGRGQFSAVPQNIAGANDTVDYLNSGVWSEFAIREAQKFVSKVNVVGGAVDTEQGRAIAAAEDWQLSADAAYFHYCPNETVDGVALHEIPAQVTAPVVADMSSNILSEPLNVERYALIYAGAQKNIGPSGFAIAIVRDDLLGRAQGTTSTIMDYTVQAKDKSMYNTPNTWAWYLSGLVFEWLKEQGGVAVMGQVNARKAQLLYNYIDSSDFYSNPVHPDYRSKMNVPFLLADPQRDDDFLKAAEQQGLLGLKGHRFVGGMRASIYNAMPIEGVIALVDFMREFEQKHT
ncbi:3-phosphoserine/phosphohydroxythreonine transaminase [Pseudidiomarina sp. 1APP75-32.1]|uniref:Phosphoserine aminotransferase n=1 Tax=Pseudidiomarina terrestris TaxID=2820060 RepID=A0AAW7QYT0_9GAMM|nr:MULTISPECIES: 3-phosphoserine/phosphohydroxythreonine transaminase [unclassified Pseudidiomarina]MDN7124223.1 3-phosphoserine/phosphohydroxythreonine transaminase [Pseudidiomarina sp. 1APP75-32.1]MEA3586958.1 3-phosphoserine/phosphohydroxythreonine transaminase [Pseudidiomarina sp. 1APP75-27a]